MESIATSTDVNRRRKLSHYLESCLKGARVRLGIADESLKEADSGKPILFDEAPDLTLPDCDYSRIAKLVETLSKDPDDAVKSKAKQSLDHLVILSTRK